MTQTRPQNGTVLDDVCSHLPANSTADRAFVAGKFLDVRITVNVPMTQLLDAGIAKFGTVLR
jgi:hypothetical protein